MAEIIGYDPITGEPIWDDPTLNTPAPEPLPTLDNNPKPIETPVTYDTAVYMMSDTPIPEGEDVPQANHQGIALTDSEVFQLVDMVRWWSSMQYTPKTSANVLLVVDGVSEDKAPIYKVDISGEPITIRSARS